MLEPKYKQERSRAAKKRIIVKVWLMVTKFASTLANLNRSKPGSVIYSRGDLQRKDAVTRGPFLNSTVSSSNGMLVGTMSRSELPPVSHAAFGASLQVISMRTNCNPRSELVWTRHLTHSRLPLKRMYVPTGTYPATTVIGGATAPGAAENGNNDGRIAQFDSVNM